jgi:16S rRNA processing protein RimM
VELKNPILLGTIGRAQGVRGEVRVKSHTQNPVALADYGVLFDALGRRFEVLDIRKHKTVVVVRFLGINDRTAAEGLNGIDLFVDRANLSDDDLEDDEFYYTDLEGLDVLDADGKNWGTIQAIFDFGGGDLIEIRAKGQKPVLIPFTTDAVPEVDIKAGRVVIDPEAAGLLDDTSEDDEDDFDEGGD